MKANINTQEVGTKNPSLFGMITAPSLQFERIKNSEKVWGMFFLVVLLQGLVGGFTTYVVNNSPEMIKMQEELGEIAGKSSMTSEIIYGIVSSFVGAMFGALFIAAIYKIFMMFFGNDISYKKLLAIIVYTNTVLIIGELINGIIALILNSGAIQYTSLGPLFEQGSLAYGIGNTIEVFYLWNLVLVWLGLQITAGLSKVKAAIPIIILFVIKGLFLATIIVLIAQFLPSMPL